MEVSMRSLVFTSMYAVIFGAALGMFYDVFRILRIIFGVSEYGGRPPHCRLYKKGIPDLFSGKRGKAFSSVFVCITDIFYFVLSGIAFILFLYCFNYGRFRWFILLFTVLGFRLYYLSVGKAVIAVSGALSEFVKLFLNTVLFALLYPFRAAARLLSRFFRKTVRPAVFSIVFTIDKCRLKRYTLKCIKKIDKIVDKWVDV